MSTLFQLAVTFFLLLLACVDSLSLLPAPSVVSEACLHTREHEMFGLLVAWVVQKVYSKTGPFSHNWCSFFGLPADISIVQISPSITKCDKILHRDVVIGYTPSLY